MSMARSVGRALGEIGTAMNRREEQQRQRDFTTRRDMLMHRRRIALESLEAQRRTEREDLAHQRSVELAGERRKHEISQADIKHRREMERAKTAHERAKTREQALETQKQKGRVEVAGIRADRPRTGMTREERNWRKAIEMAAEQGIPSDDPEFNATVQRNYEILQGGPEGLPMAGPGAPAPAGTGAPRRRTAQEKRFIYDPANRTMTPQ